MISDKPWRVDTVASLFLGIMAMLCFAQFFGIALDSEKLKMSAEHREFAKMALGSIFLDGAILVCVGFFLRESRISWSEAFGLEKARQPGAVALGILAALLFVPLEMAWMYWAQLLLAHPVAQPLVEALQKTDLPLAEKALMGVLAVFLAPLAEEMIFRGILYPTIKQAGFPRTAWWVTSLLFGAIHLNWVAFVPLTVFSLLLIFIYEKTGSLWASITAHSLFNFTSFAMLMLAAEPGPRNSCPMNEFELIASLCASLPSNAGVIAGAGDDCAVLDSGQPGRALLFKTDAVVEGIHFLPSAEPESIGHKALARCLSDIAAMAGRPLAALVTLALPKNFDPRIHPENLRRHEPPGPPPRRGHRRRGNDLQPGAAFDLGRAPGRGGAGQMRAAVRGQGRGRAVCHRGTGRLAGGKTFGIRAASGGRPLAGGAFFHSRHD